MINIITKEMEIKPTMNNYSRSTGLTLKTHTQAENY